MKQQPNSPRLNRFLLVLCYFAFLVFSPNLYSQCNVHNVTFGLGPSVSPHNPNDQNGQTFLACDNGEVTSVSIGYIVVYPGTYELYMGIDPGAGNPLPTTPAATLVVTTEYSGIVTFNFPIPFSVLNDGTIYRFAIASPTPSFIKRHLDDYSGGSLIEPDYNPDSLYDIDFEIAIQPTSADVPTLSEWGLLILALSFMTLGTLYLLQPKFRGGIFEQER